MDLPIWEAEEKEEDPKVKPRLSNSEDPKSKKGFNLR